MRKVEEEEVNMTAGNESDIASVGGPMSESLTKPTGSRVCSMRASLFSWQIEGVLSWCCFSRSSSKRFSMIWATAFRRSSELNSKKSSS